MLKSCNALKTCEQTLRVHVPNNWVRRVVVIVIIVQVLVEYMIIMYLDP